MTALLFFLVWVNGLAIGLNLGFRWAVRKTHMVNLKLHDQLQDVIKEVES